MAELSTMRCRQEGSWRDRQRYNLPRGPALATQPKSPPAADLSFRPPGDRRHRGAGLQPGLRNLRSKGNHETESLRRRYGESVRCHSAEEWQDKLHLRRSATADLRQCAVSARRSAALLVSAPASRPQNRLLTLENVFVVKMDHVGPAAPACPAAQNHRAAAPRYT